MTFTGAGPAIEGRRTEAFASVGDLALDKSKRLKQEGIKCCVARELTSLKTHAQWRISLRFEIAELSQQGTCSATLILNFWVCIWLLKTCLVGCFLLVTFSKKKRRAWSPGSDSFIFFWFSSAKGRNCFYLSPLTKCSASLLASISHEETELSASCNSANHCCGQLRHAEQPGPLPTLLQQGWLCWRCWISAERLRARNQSNHCSSYLLCEDA